MIDHHDVLVGLIDCSGRLRPGTDGRAAVLDGGSGRLYLRPLKKLEQGRERGEKTRNRSDFLGRDWKHHHDIILLLFKGCHIFRKLRGRVCLSINGKITPQTLIFQGRKR